MAYTYAYPRPALTVDVVVMRGAPEASEVLLIQRAREPFAGSWALPGGFVEVDETLDVAAKRELAEETGVLLDSVSLVGVFDDPERDPRERVISVAFWGLAPPSATGPCAQDDAQDARWFPLAALPTLAFDHSAVIALAVERRRGAH